MGLSSLQSSDARRNNILGSLPQRDWERLESHLEPVKLKLGQVVNQSGSPLHHVYLPTSSTISLQYVTLDGASTEIAAVGSEGLIGIAVYMGGGPMNTRAVVQRSGFAYRITRETVNEEFRNGGALRRLLLLYTQARLTLVLQTAACNRHHSVDQRLSRWLLSSWDRSDAAQLLVTHELISKSLGVRREGITEAAGKLQRSGIIASSRGRTMLLDRRRLETCSCECYGVVRREYARLLGDICYRPEPELRDSLRPVAGGRPTISKAAGGQRRSLRSKIAAPAMFAMS
jgi:CRP-like cAMP-binding protein